MTAPADLPALLAEGRRLIEEATKGPYTFDPGDDLVWATDDHYHFADLRGPYEMRGHNGALVAFALNSLPLLLAVAEAAEKVHGDLEEETLYAKGCVGQDEVTGEACEWHRLLLALDAALRGEVKNG